MCVVYTRMSREKLNDCSCKLRVVLDITLICSEQVTVCVMANISEDIVPAQQQQSTEDKTELCVGVQPADNDKMRGSKRELVATTYKMTQIEKMSEYCISKIEVIPGCEINRHLK